MFKVVSYVFQAKKGIEKPGELASDVSFGFLQSFFVTSFIILGIITGLLWLLGIRFDSNFLKVFAVLFTIVLSVDVVIYIRVKKMFSHISKRVVDYGKKAYKKENSRIIDVE